MAGHRLTSAELQRLEFFLRLDYPPPNKWLEDEFRCGRRTIQRYRRRVATTKTVALRIPSLTPSNSVKLEQWALEELKGLLIEKPDLYLDEMQCFLAETCRIDCSISTISRALKACDWSNKRIHILARQRDEDLRGHYLYKVNNLSHSVDMFVFCDESGLDKRDGARRTGWAPVGYTPRTESLLRRGGRFHILPAITIDGLLAVWVYKGHTTKEVFLQWLIDQVLPKMNPYPGPRSILVMDNASWHHDEAIYKAIDSRGVMPVYLPPYSPDFNPIEAYFGDLKRHIRRQYQYTMSDYDSDEKFAHFLLTSAEEVAQRSEAIEGHFRHARVPMNRREAGD